MSEKRLIDYETLDDIIDKIEDEFVRAKKIHPHFPDNIVEQVAVMAEEAGECVKDANDVRWKNQDTEHLKTELIQTAAMCVRILEKLELKKENESEAK